MASNPPEPPLKLQQLQPVVPNVRDQQPQLGNLTVEDQDPQSPNEIPVVEAYQDVSRELEPQRPQQTNEVLGDHQNPSDHDKTTFISKRVNEVCTFIALCITIGGHIGVALRRNDKEIIDVITASTGFALHYCLFALIVVILLCVISHFGLAFWNTLTNTSSRWWCVMISSIVSNFIRCGMDVLLYNYAFGLYKIFWEGVKVLIIVLCSIRALVMVISLIIIVWKGWRRN